MLDSDHLAATDDMDVVFTLNRELHKAMDAMERAHSQAVRDSWRCVDCAYAHRQLKFAQSKMRNCVQLLEELSRRQAASADIA